MQPEDGYSMRLADKAIFISAMIIFSYDLNAVLT